MNLLNITNDLVQAISIPIIFVGIGLLAKWLGKRERDESTKTNDWAVNTSVILMTLSQIITDVTEQEAGNGIVAIPGWLVSLSVLWLFISLQIDRSWSWKKDKQTGILTNEKRVVVGIIIPNLISIIIFAGYKLYKIYTV